MQNHFGEAIRNNIGDRDNMYKAIWCIFEHMIRNDSEALQEQHDLCPRNSWCSFWCRRDQYDNDKRLPSVFVDELKPLFIRLGPDHLLDRCLKGMTKPE